MERGHPFDIEDALLHPQQVRPFHGPVVRVGRTLQQVTDQFGTFVRIRFGGKGFRFLPGRHLSGHVQKRAPDKGSVRTVRRWQGAHLLEFGEDVFIHQITWGRGVPDKVRPVGDEGEAHRRFQLLETDHHGGLPAFLRLHQTVAGDLGQEVGRFVDRPARDIAGGTIRERGGGGELHVARWAGDDGLRRANGQGSEHRSVRRVHRRPGRDPIVHHPVFLGVLFKPLPALVFGEFRRFLQEKAGLGIVHVETFAAHVLRQHGMISGG